LRKLYQAGFHVGLSIGNESLDIYGRWLGIPWNPAWVYDCQSSAGREPEPPIGALGRKRVTESRITMGDLAAKSAQTLFESKTLHFDLLGS
jgi:hypothetical protein